jgi:hypothetical protein
MTDLGFDVSDGSRSNYNLTALTLSSMLNGQHVNDLLPNPPEGVAAQARKFSKLINDGAVLQEARARGYEIVSLPSEVGYVTLFAADRVIEPPQMTEFELSLTEQEIAIRIAPQARREFFLDQHRQRILGTFATLQHLPLEPAERPRLVFAHLLLPHVPIAFGPAGEPVVVEGCVWTLCPTGQTISEDLRTAYAAQVAYTDMLVKATAQAIIERSPHPPVIVFFSDHGTRLVPGKPSVMFYNLILSYTPGRPHLIPRDATPIAIWPRLANAYLGTDEPLASDTSYVLSPGTPGGGFFPLEVFSP